MFVGSVFLYVCTYISVCLQVVVESGVVPKLVPLLSSDENKIVVCELLKCDYIDLHALLEECMYPISLSLSFRFPSTSKMLLL